MLHINQNQLDVIQFEKETIMLSVKLLQKNYKIYVDTAPLLKFFDGLTLSSQEKSECKGILISLSKCIQECMQHCLHSNDTPTYSYPEDYIHLCTKVGIDNLFNKYLLDVSIYTEIYLLKKEVSLYTFLKRVLHLLHQRTFISTDELHRHNRKTFLSLDAYVSLSDACYYGLSYPNSTTILNDFSTIEKLNIFFKPYFE